MSEPSIERQGAAMYLTDDTGERWRVHDAHFSGGRPHRVPLGFPRAHIRHFVNAQGERRAYTFVKDRRRDLTLDALLEHFHGAG